MESLHRHVQTTYSQLRVGNPFSFGDGQCQVHRRTSGVHRCARKGDTFMLTLIPRLEVLITLVG